jgi:hypothetical protein
LQTVPPDANPPLRLLTRAQQIFDAPQPSWIVQAPERDMWIAATVNTGTEYAFNADEYQSRVRFSYRSARQRQTVLRRPLPLWARYPVGVVTALADAGLDIPAFHALLLGNEPQGPRYDFGLGMVTAAFCYALAGRDAAPGTLMEVVEQVRREYVEG